MNKGRIGLILSLALFFTTQIFSQTLDQGKKFIYYERFKSAKDVLQKIVATTPNNEEAVYWLGQSMIRPDDRTANDLAVAKKLYQTALSSAPNSTLIMAGIGHIELIEGSFQDARNHFEAAISLSEGKNISVLNAIGFANGNPDSKNGDAEYSINKLKQATQIKKFNDPDVLVNLGDAYRKNGDGGNAHSSYTAALTLDPKYARANYRLGRLYQSQGKNQETLFMDYYNAAINSDPAYAPVYNNLFNYFYETNVTKSAEYFEKWQANADVDNKTCYYKASLKYAQALFNEAITKADECIATEGDNAYPNLFGLKALAYNRLKDSVAAKTNYDEYFKRQLPEKIVPGDYSQYAQLLLKFSGNEEQAGLLTDKAVALDSLDANKITYLKSMASYYDAQKKYKNAADWYKKILSVKKNPTKTDLYNAGYGYFRGGDYTSSVEIFNQYTQKFPEDIFGYYMLGKTNALIDTTGELGSAVPFYQKAIEIGEKEADKNKVKAQLTGSYQYFIEYYYNVKKDQATALSYIDKALSLEPNDAQLISNREFISKNDPKAAPKKPATPKQPSKPRP